MIPILIGVIVIAIGIATTQNKNKNNVNNNESIVKGESSDKNLSSNSIIKANYKLEKDSIIIGEEALIYSQIEPESILKTQKITYKSTDENVVKVDSDGKVLGVGLGSAKIIAKIGAVEKELDINVVSKDDIAIEYGSYVSFGNINNNKEKPIIWRMIGSTDDACLLISDKVLNVHEYGENSRWDDSSLRKWLNGEFLTFFNEEEDSLIPSTNIDTIYDGSNDEKDVVNNIKETDEIISPVNNENYVQYTTEDRVFILSKDEYEIFLDSETMNYGIGESIAANPGEKMVVPYWLRCTDFEYYMTYDIESSSVPCLGEYSKSDEDEYLPYVGVANSKKEMGVRPVLFIQAFDITGGDGSKENPYTVGKKSLDI